MSCGTEQERAVVFAERREIFVYGYRVGRGHLLGVGYVVDHVVTSLVFGYYTGGQLLEQCAVLRRYGEVYRNTTPAARIERPFVKMLLEGGDGPVVVTVE